MPIIATGWTNTQWRSFAQIKEWAKANGFRVRERGSRLYVFISKYPKGKQCITYERGRPLKY